jgi:hypothetical protein
MELVILAEPAATVQPSESPLGHPAMGQEYPAFAPVRALDNAQEPAALLPGPGAECARVAAVRPDPEQAGPFRQRLREHELGAVAVLDPGTMDDHRQQEPQRIYQEMALATVDLLVFVAADGGFGPPFL